MKKDIKNVILLNVMNIPNYYFLLFVDEEIYLFNAIVAIFIFAFSFTPLRIKDKT